jgi:hypothetical protein
MVTDPAELYTHQDRTPPDTEAEISATLAAFAARNGHPTPPKDHTDHRIVLDCQAGGVLTLVICQYPDGGPTQLLESFRAGRKSKTIHLTDAAMDALCALWQASRKGGQ